MLAADGAGREVADRRGFGDGEERVDTVTQLVVDRTGLEEESPYHTRDIELVEELLDGCGGRRRPPRAGGVDGRPTTAAQSGVFSR